MADYSRFAGRDQSAWPLWALWCLRFGIVGAVIGAAVAVYYVWFAPPSPPRPAQAAKPEEPINPPTPAPQDMRPVPAAGTVPFAVPEEVPVAQSGIAALEFSPDGKRLAVASFSGGVFLIDVATAKTTTLQLEIPTTMEPTRQALAFRPDGRLLAWCCGGHVKTYDLAARKVVASAGQPYPDACCRFVDDGASLLVAAVFSGQVRLVRIDPHTGAVTANESLPTTPYVASRPLVLAPDGSLFASMMERNDTRPERKHRTDMLVEMQVRAVPAGPMTQPQTTTSHWGGRANRADYVPKAISPDNRRVLSSGFDEARKKDSVYLHPVGSDRTWRATDYDVAYGFSPDGGAVIVGVGSPQPVKHRPGYQYTVARWYWVEVGRPLSSGEYPPPRSGALPELRQRGSGLPLAYNAMAFSRDQKKAAYGDVNGSVWLGAMNVNPDNLKESPSWLVMVVNDGMTTPDAADPPTPPTPPQPPMLPPKPLPEVPKQVAPAETERYQSIWVRSNAPDDVMIAAPRNVFFDQTARLKRAGSVLHAVDLCVLDGKETYSAVWRKLPGADETYIGLTRNLFGAKTNELTRAGWQVHAIEGYLVNGQERFCAEWRKPAAQTQWVIGWSRDDIARKIAEMQKAGWWLQSLDAHRVGSTFGYNAVWRQGKGEQRVVLGVARDDFERADEAARKDGFRAVLLDGFGKAELYSAVWRRSKEETLLMLDIGRADMEKAVPQLSRDGWRLQTIDTRVKGRDE